jgi:hypothetical protein
MFHVTQVNSGTSLANVAVLGFGYPELDGRRLAASSARLFQTLKASGIVTSFLRTAC